MQREFLSPQEASVKTKPHDDVEKHQRVVVISKMQIITSSARFIKRINMISPPTDKKCRRSPVTGTAGPVIMSSLHVGLVSCVNHILADFLLKLLPNRFHSLYPLASFGIGNHDYF